MLQTYFSTPDKTNIDSVLLLGQHRRLWNTYGPAITTSFEQITEVEFLQNVRAVITIDKEGESGQSNSGITGREAMELCYPGAYIPEKRILWLLCHELGHRLEGQHEVYLDKKWHNTLPETALLYEAHRRLFVYLIDVILHAFPGKVAHDILQWVDTDNYNVDKDDPSYPSYTKAWKWARRLSHEERYELTQTIFQDKTRAPLPHI
jgi:hypothetical protein